MEKKILLIEWTIKRALYKGLSLDNKQKRHNNPINT